MNMDSPRTATGYMTRQIYMQYAGRDDSYSGGTVNRIEGNTFTANYGAGIDLDNTSDTLVKNNTSTGALGSKNNSNGNWYQANLIQMGGTSSKRNIVEDNTVSSIVRQGYMETIMEGSRICVDVGPNFNIFQRNVIHDIGWLGSLQGQTDLTVGFFNESYAHDNTYQQNIIYNIGHTCMLSGGW